MRSASQVISVVELTETPASFSIRAPAKFPALTATGGWSLLGTGDSISYKQGTWCEYPLVEEEKLGPKLCRILTFHSECAGPTTNYHNFVGEIGGVFR